MYVARAVQLLLVGALFWAILYLGGKVAGPDRERLAVIGQAAHDVVVGLVQTAKEVASGPPPAPVEPTQLREPPGP